MSVLSPESLAAYWSGPEVATNIVVFMNLLGALLLGLVVGYERTYHGRAAGMRTYGLVCMASAALTAIVGYPEFWYAGHPNVAGPAADPTRVMQGIVTGVGFLGAGVIMKEGLNISGLTTAASIWASCAIGVLVGVGFYAAAILLTFLSASCMLWVSRLESSLPSRPAIGVMLGFEPEYVPVDDVLGQALSELGYDIAWGSLQITHERERLEWRFVAVARGRNKGASLPDMAQLLSSFVGVDRYQIAHARN